MRADRGPHEKGRGGGCECVMTEIELHLLYSNKAKYRDAQKGQACFLQPRARAALNIKPVQICQQTFDSLLRSLKTWTCQCQVSQIYL